MSSKVDVISPVLRGLTWNGNVGAIVVPQPEGEAGSAPGASSGASGAGRARGSEAGSRGTEAGSPGAAGQAVGAGYSVTIAAPDDPESEDAWIAALAEGLGDLRHSVRDTPVRVAVDGVGAFGIAGDIESARAAVGGDVAGGDTGGGAPGGSAAGGGSAGAPSASRSNAADAPGQAGAAGKPGSATAGVSAVPGTTAGSSAPGAGHMAGRVCVVTGGAQGFGEQIVRYLREAGAIVAIADLQADNAAALSKELNDAAGSTVTFPVAVDVSDESSVAAMVSEVVRTVGGIDLFVSNAGVLVAGSVKTLPHKSFRFVTSVNYDGFFLCTQAASPVMSLQFRAQRAADARAAGANGKAGGAEASTGGASDAGEASLTDGYMTDMVQLNSKSGLVGSNRNGAYAGSKFGAVGLVESFALELIEDGIKVNAICPGNFFDGPLWSDPEKGLFVQYLHAGKVPGAKTIADVKRHYEKRVPMGRGCQGKDVARALLYIVEQRYETGQAIPVTGGQVMLH